jgi:hypothetical protein
MPKVLALRVDPYDIPADAENPKGNKGNSFWFVGTNNDAGQNGGFGNKPMKIGLTDQLVPALRDKLPAICEVDFEMKAGAGNKATLTVTSLTVLGSFDLQSLLAKKS